jgi:hypothetical protein
MEGTLGRQRRPPLQHPVSMEINGRVIEGRYTVEGRPPRIVTVHSVYGSKATQAGGLPPEEVARLLLQELAKEAERKP